MNNKQLSWDMIYFNAKVATLVEDNDYGIIENGVIATKQDKIAYIGSYDELHSPIDGLAKQQIDCEGRCITPGLIDCHTHLVYAGSRANEFEQRLQGMSYADIARAGGGIRSTVKATRAASEAALYQASLPRLSAMINQGVTTVEIKSGYGIELATELKQLRVAKQLEKNLPVDVATTFLGAHTLPPEFQDEPDAYIDHVCNDMIPAIATQQLAEAVDVFCEDIAFDLKQTERVFQAAQQQQLAIKCHAEQLTNLGATALAAKYHAISCDHLEYLPESSVQQMAKTGTVAVLLPGAFYFLQETQKPPIDILRQYKVPIAIATDCNPGSSPTTSLLLMLNMACTLFQLTPLEALLGVTRHAAKALQRATSVGSLAIGKQADFVLWNIEHPRDLVYQFGVNPCYAICKNGEFRERTL